MLFSSHVSDYEGGGGKNRHTPYSENTPDGDLVDQTKVSETSGKHSHQVTKVKLLCPVCP